MDPNHLTQKSQEALHDAQTKALRFGHTEVDVEHLLLALLDQSEGIVPPLLSQAGADPDKLRAALESELRRRPGSPGRARTRARSTSPSGWPASWTPPSRRPAGSRTSTSPSSTSSWPCSARAGTLWLAGCCGSRD